MKKSKDNIILDIDVKNERVGIGTSIPSEILDNRADSVLYSSGDSYKECLNNDANEHRLTIVSAGNVGIGTTA